MAVWYIDTKNIREAAKNIKAGDEVYLSGTVYTARDAAHKRIVGLINDGNELPFDLNDAVIYYSGPTPERPGMPIGSCGPTTSSRMDGFAPILLKKGLCAMIGKGPRKESVINAINECGGVYFCAVGGAGALAAMCVKKLEVIAFEDLGCESVKKLEVENFPLLCAIDCHGGNLFNN